MDEHPSTAAIILAAGSSSRIGAGRHKLLLPLGGRPVLAHVVEATLASQARPIIIVLGHQADQVRAVLGTLAAHPAITLVENRNYLEGMSSSIQVGLQALMDTNTTALYRTDSALILLGDQPLMTTEIIDRLIASRHITGKRIITPLYQGRRGNPVLFDASLFGELLEVTGDEGGKSVVDRHRQEVASVEGGNTMASYDVDTWEAYQEVVAEWQRQKS
ncbi:MAG TPA: nucleotidyltransferase family protein [Ktedonosporobacter sp.]|nr:nucleotidyltransferase family protein [Ktedonosporobacter sp.]